MGGFERYKRPPRLDGHLAKCIDVVFLLRGTCQVCQKQFWIPDLLNLPEKCPRCKSKNWMSGPKHRWATWRKARVRALRGRQLLKVPIEHGGEKGQKDEVLGR